eukprot:768003-Hanusia_phi.AAC.4
MEPQDNLGICTLHVSDSCFKREYSLDQFRSCRLKLRRTDLLDVLHETQELGVGLSKFLVLLQDRIPLMRADHLGLAEHLKHVERLNGFDPEVNGRDEDKPRFHALGQELQTRIQLVDVESSTSCYESVRQLPHAQRPICSHGHDQVSVSLHVQVSVLLSFPPAHILLRPRRRGLEKLPSVMAIGDRGGLEQQGAGGAGVLVVDGAYLEELVPLVGAEDKQGREGTRSLQEETEVGAPSRR